MPENEGPSYSNLDDVIKQMQLDEAADAPLITPVNYAKIRQRVTPQLVYYRIRTGKLQTHTCNCGRKCIDIKEADEVFGFTETDESETDAELHVACPMSPVDSRRRRARGYVRRPAQKTSSGR